MYKYQLENCTGMPLRYECSTTIAGVGVQFEGIIAPSSAALRRKHGANPSFATLADGDVLTCRVWDASEGGLAKPPKNFTISGTNHNHVTLHCPTPLEEECNPVELMMSGKFIAPDRHHPAPPPPQPRQQQPHRGPFS